MSIIVKIKKSAASAHRFRHVSLSKRAGGMAKFNARRICYINEADIGWSGDGS
jgi:hypothetical protein